MNANEAFNHQWLLISQFSPETLRADNPQWIYNWLSVTSASHLSLDQYNVDKLLWYAAAHYMETAELSYVLLFQSILEELYAKGFLLSSDGLMKILFYKIRVRYTAVSADQCKLMQQQMHNIVHAIIGIYSADTACMQALSTFQRFLGGMKLYGANLSAESYDLAGPTILRFGCVNEDAQDSSSLLGRFYHKLVGYLSCRPKGVAKALTDVLYAACD